MLLKYKRHGFIPVVKYPGAVNLRTGRRQKTKTHTL